MNLAKGASQGIGNYNFFFPDEQNCLQIEQKSKYWFTEIEIHAIGDIKPKR